MNVNSLEFPLEELAVQHRTRVVDGGSVEAGTSSSMPERPNHDNEAGSVPGYGWNRLHQLVRDCFEKKPVDLSSVENMSDSELELLDAQAECSVPQLGIHKMKLNPVQLAAVAGTAKVLETFLEKKLLIESDEEKRNKVSNGCVNRSNKFVYRLDGLLPKIFIGSTSSEHNAAVEGESVLELISMYCNTRELVRMTSIKHLRAILDHKAILGVHTALYLLLASLHIWYMALLSWYLIPTCNQFNSTQLNSNSNRTSGNHQRGSWHYWQYLCMMLIWPVFCLAVEIICFIRFVGDSKKCRRCAVKQNRSAKELGVGCFDASLNVARLKIQNFGHWLLLNREQLPLTGYITRFRMFSRISTITFAFLCIILVCDVSTSLETYSLIVSSLLLCGWLHTINLLQIPPFHAFIAMIKVIVIRDVIRIAFISVFVIVGFTLAILASMSSADTVQSDVTGSVYHAFLVILGKGPFNDDVTKNLPNPRHFVRLLFAAYFCVTTVILLNVLIAMMNHTYSDVVRQQDDLWRVEGVHFVVNLARDGSNCCICKWLLSAIRYLLCWTTRYLLSQNSRGKPSFVIYDDEKVDPTLETISQQIDELKAKIK